MSKKPVQLDSENKLIRLLQDRYRIKNPLVRKGIGDDAAVLRPRHAEEYWLITTDMLMENIDFRRRWTTAGDLGRKSIAVNLSDLAAMGARPRFYTVSLALPREISRKWILDFYDGLTGLGSSMGAMMIGGDFSSSESGISISIAALGESLRRKILYRSGGQAGDLLYVTGILGKSAAGFKLLEKGLGRACSGPQKAAVQAHQRPEARCDAGLWLAQSGLVHCMMDLSDGLSMDLPRMCAAGNVGAEIDSAKLPIFRESAQWGLDPISLALHGGEDFELLFAVPGSKADLLKRTYPARFPQITRIGILTGDAGAVWVHEPAKKRRRLREGGYDHFRRRKPVND